MEINNLNQTQQITITTNKTEDLSKTQSFASYLVQNRSEIKTEQSEILNYLDKYNAFENYSEEDEKIYREVLLDGKLTDRDMEKLSFKQIQQLQELLLTDREKVKDPNADFSLPIIGVLEGRSWSLISASNYTNNDKFNKALFESIKQIDREEDRRNLFSEVSTNISEVAFGADPRHPAHGRKHPIEGFEFINPENKHKFDNIDYGKFFNDYMSYIDKNLNTPNLAPEFYDYLKYSKGLYTILQENYQNVIKQEQITPPPIPSHDIIQNNYHKQSS